MFVEAGSPRLVVRRITHSAHRRLRRGHVFTELSCGDDVIWSVVRCPSAIVFIDPKALTRESFLKMLDTSLPERVKLLGVSDFKELLELSKIANFASTEGEVSLIILYMRSAGVSNGWVQQQMRLIKAECPDLPVILLSDRDDACDVRDALNCGVRGYIPTSIGVDVAIAALTLIGAGGTYIPANVLRHDESPANVLRYDELEIQSGARAGETGHTRAELNLTTRELAVIHLLREGCANKVIALKLNLRESTVKVHVRNILKKLRVSNRTHAATVADRLLSKSHEATAPSDLS